jgi:hypothetical protein
MAPTARRQLVDFAAKNRLSTMFTNRDYVAAGGLMSYARNFSDVFRHAAQYVDKILKGAKPADLPVEQPTKFELVINLKTAKALGLSIPPSVLALTFDGGPDPEPRRVCWRSCGDTTPARRFSCWASRRRDRLLMRASERGVSCGATSEGSGTPPHLVGETRR